MGGAGRKRGRESGENMRAIAISAQETPSFAQRDASNELKVRAPPMRGHAASGQIIESHSR